MLISDAHGLIILQRLKNYTDLEDVPFYLRENYDNQSARTELKGAVSLVNSMLHQRRVFFCITQPETRSLIKEDRNWKKKRKNAGLAKELYRRILAILLSNKIIKCIHAEKGRKAWAYKLIDEELIKIINLTPEELKIQEEKTIQFSKRGGKSKTTSITEMKY